MHANQYAYNQAHLSLEPNTAQVELKIEASQSPARPYSKYHVERS